MKHFFSKIGPGAIVSAAFIGPGTVTTSTLCGAQYGYTLLWVVTFSIIMTYVLQEMSARLGVVGLRGLGDAIYEKSEGKSFKYLILLPIFATLLFGNIAYEAGNITGAVIGFDSYPFIPKKVLVIFVSCAAFLILFYGKYKQIELLLVTLVGLMGFVFLVIAIALKPDYTAIVKASFLPIIPENSKLMIMSIIGTTVVPYNLFLHASSIKEKWQGEQYLNISKWDSIIGIVLGGIITAAILITSKIIFNESGSEITKANELANQLKPILGNWATIFIALGYLFAGFASTITAPLASALASAELFKLEKSWKSNNFRLIWGIVLLSGALFASLGIKPMKLILFAQWANGFILPFISLFLLWIMNDKSIMGKHSNSLLQNSIAIMVIACTFYLAFLTFS